MTTFLIIIGICLFLLRSQLLRVALMESGGASADPKLLHVSPSLGAASGWLSLAGAALLMLLAIVENGYLWGSVIVLGSIATGIVVSSLALPVIGSTLMLGHHGGEGMKSIVEFNRRYGAHFAFAVAGLAALAWALHLR